VNVYLQKTVTGLLLSLCLLPGADSRAVAPETLFEQAMTLRAEKPDEAQPLFTEAALNFEADNEFLNAANSWFFANENGRALANYRAAEKRMPWNRQIRESIAFIRAQRSDRFQTLENSAMATQRFTAHASRIWKNFCRWSPAIRIGLLTGIYLIGWAVVLIARVSGRRIPRRVRIAGLILAAIPAVSLLYSVFQPSEGIVIQAAEARLGPGYAYEPAYDTILHEATEFQGLETRDGWIHARLPDRSEAWILQTSCVVVK
jgi:hypothetical protein